MFAAALLVENLVLFCAAALDIRHVHTRVVQYDQTWCKRRELGTLCICFILSLGRDIFLSRQNPQHHEKSTSQKAEEHAAPLSVRELVPLQGSRAADRCATGKTAMAKLVV